MGFFADNGVTTAMPVGGQTTQQPPSGVQATAPGSYGTAAADPHVAQLVADYIQQNGLTANQSDPASLNKIAQYLQSQGVNAQTAYTDQNGHTGGLVVNGQEMQLIDGSNNWTALQPWQASGPGGGAGGAGGGSPAGGYGSLLTPWTQQFTAPTAQDALNTPGLQFAMEQAQKGMERSAASRGDLLSGGLQTAEARQQTGMALQGYGDAYNRALGEYSLARDNFFQNQDRPYNKLMGISSQGENAAAQVGNYGSQYATNATNTITNQGNANAAGSSAQSNIWSPLPANLGTLGTTPPALTLGQSSYTQPRVQGY